MEVVGQRLGIIYQIHQYMLWLQEEYKHLLYFTVVIVVVRFLVHFFMMEHLLQLELIWLKANQQITQEMLVLVLLLAEDHLP